MRSESQLNIHTPENIAFGYDLADIGSRFQAALIDTTAIVVLQFVATLVAVVLASRADALDAAGWVIGLYIALLFVLLWGYYIIFELVWNGQTPGKRYIGLRVVNRNGVPVNLAGTLIRNLVRIIDFIPIGYGVGVVAMFFNKNAMRLGDLAAGTLVVRDKTVSLDDLKADTAQTASWQPSQPMDAPNLPLERLSENDIAMIEAFLGRRNVLKTQRALLRPILQHLYDRMDMPLEKQLHHTVAMTRLEQIVATKRGLIGPAQQNADNSGRIDSAS